MAIFPLGISRSRDIASVAESLAIGSADVRWSHEGDLACAFVDARHNGIQPTQHAAALDTIHSQISVLPMPFGAILRNETEVHDLLRSRHDTLLAQLGRLDWTCEMSLRITMPPTTKPRVTRSGPVESGPTCVRERRIHGPSVASAATRDCSIVQQVVEHLHGTYREWRRLLSSPSQPIRLSFLVERGRVQAFQSRLAESHRIWQKGHCLVLGPWPPYSFV